MKVSLAVDFDTQWRAVLEGSQVGENYAVCGEQIGRRALANLALSYLASIGGEEQDVAVAHYENADNLTNRLAALQAVLAYGSAELANRLLEDFFARFGHEALAVNHWLQVQAGSPAGDALERVRLLSGHPAYDPGNPNKIRSLVGTFANANPTGFHRNDGQGYAFLSDVIENLNERNPQIASRLLTPLTRWRNFHEPVAARMRGELERLASLPALSRDVYEVVSKSLK
jgi:aminopeptidase N